MVPIPIFEAINTILLTKIILITIGVLYTVYSILVLRQVNLMEKTLETSANPLITALAIAQLLAAVVLTLLSFVS